MASLSAMLRHAKRRYHHWMYMYNFTLFRDCADPQLKAKYQRRAVYHAERMDRS